MIEKGEKKSKKFHEIYKEITLSPGIPLYEIAEKTGLSRNTVSKYVGEMYQNMILRGPQIRLKPAPDYREYVYLMNFKNPFHFYQNVRGFPHVIYHAMTFGDWNTMVMTDGQVDFSQLTGYERTVFQGVRYRSVTPLTKRLSWEKCFEKVSREIATFEMKRERKDRQLAPVLGWGEDQWKMYYAFKDNTRKTATTTLKQVHVRYETYVTWMKDLDTHCSYHTGFYPEGYPAYLTYCFLFSTEYEETVRRVFSRVPATPFIMEVGDQLLVLASVVLSGAGRKLFCSICDMKTRGIIKDVRHATFLFHTGRG